MIPIFISEAMPVSLMIKILLIKLLLGIFWGFTIDFIFRKFISKSKQNESRSKEDGVQNNIEEESNEFEEICEDEHCHCHEQGILKASLIHTINITGYIFIITLIIAIVLYIIGFFLGRKYESDDFMRRVYGVTYEFDKYKGTVDSVTYYYSQQAYDNKVKILKEQGEDYINYE